MLALSPPFCAELLLTLPPPISRTPSLLSPAIVPLFETAVPSARKTSWFVALSNR